MIPMQHDRNLSLLADLPRLITTSVTITATGGNAFVKRKNGGPVEPASITLDTVTTVFTAPTYKWYYANSTAPGTWTLLGSTGSALVVTKADYLTHLDTGINVSYKVVATQTGFSTAETFTTITYSVEADEPIVVETVRDNSTVPTLSDGTGATLTNTGNTIRVKRGNVYLNYGASGNNTWSIATSMSPASSVTLGALDTTTDPTKAVYANLQTISDSVDVATVTYTITVRDASGVNLTPIVKTQTYTKSKNGVNGKALSVTATNTMFKYYSNNNLKAPTGDQTVTISPSGFTGTWYWTVTKDNGAESSKTSATGSSTTTTYTPDGSYVNMPDVLTYKIYDAVGASIPLASATISMGATIEGDQGTSPVVTDLSNDNVTIATNTDGSGGDYTRANTDFTIFSGFTDIIGSLSALTITPSTGVTFNYARNGGALSTNNYTTVQSVNITGLTALKVAIASIATAQDGGTLTISATYNSTVYTAVFSVSKGKAGLSATVYEIEADTGISFDPNTNTFSPATVTYSAFSVTGTAARTPYNNANGVIRLESNTGSGWSPIGTDLTLGSGVTSRTLTTSNLAAGVRFVRATLLVGGTIVDQETDALTVAGVKGASPVVTDLSNDNVTIATNTDGSGGDYSRATTNFTIFSGFTDIIGSLSSLTITASTGVTFKYTRNGVASSDFTTTTAQAVTTSGLSSLSLSVSAIATAQDGGTLTVAATYNSTVYTAVFSVSKSKAGTSATVYEIEADKGISFDPNAATNKFSPATVTYSAFSITGTAARTPYNNANGVIRLESSTDGGSWSTIGSDLTLGPSVSSRSLTTNTLVVGVRFIRATLLVGGTIVDQETDALTVAGTNGTNGTSPVVADLSNDNVTIATNTDGSGGDYSRATTNFTIFSGFTDIIGNLSSLTITASTGVTFKYTRNGVASSDFTTTTAQAVTTSGLSSLSLSVSAIATAQDGGTLTVAATYNSTVYTVVFSVSKGKAGTSATVYEIEADAGINFDPNAATNKFSPATVTYSAFSITGTAARTPYNNANGVIRLESNNGSGWTTIGTDLTLGSGVTSRTLTTNNLATDVRFVRATLLVGGTVVDQETDVITVAGISGKNITLSCPVTSFKYKSDNSLEGPLGAQTVTITTYNIATGWWWTKSIDGGSESARTGVAAGTTTATFTYTPDTYTNMPDTITVKVYDASVNGNLLAASSIAMTANKTGTGGIQYATVYLYQWATAQPSNPTGSSTYNWSSKANSAYTVSDGWSTTLSSNPGTPGIILWVASKEINAEAGTVVESSVNWTTGTVNVYPWTSDADNSIKRAEVSVYRWAITIPTITGSSTYNWGTKTIATAPTNWFRTISDVGAGSEGLTLWIATVDLVEAVSAATSSVNWTTARILPLGYSGSTGAVHRIAYTSFLGALDSTPNTYTVTGDTLPANNSWGTGTVWTTTVPTPSAGYSIWQSDGIFNPTNNQTIWEVPYLASLKVGNLASISTNTGSLTVSGNITLGKYSAIRGGQTSYNNGSGFFLGYDTSGTTAYKFSVGSSSGNSLTWNGSTLSITGSISGTSTIDGETASVVKTGAASGASALTQVNNKLNKNAADILTGQITLNTGGMILAGTTSTGVYLSPTGLYGVSGGVNTFYVNASNGNAYFKGEINATSGTFSGDLVTTVNASIIGGNFITAAGAEGTGGVRIYGPNALVPNTIYANGTVNRAVTQSLGQFAGTISSYNPSTTTNSAGITTTGDIGIRAFGTTIGVWGGGSRSNPGDVDTGVYGTGTTYGVRGIGTNGVWGSGTYGVYGSGTYGVYGTGTTYGVYSATAMYNAGKGNVPAAESIFTASSFNTQTDKTRFGMVLANAGLPTGLTGTNWYNTINIRHNNGEGDGDQYGGQLVWGATGYQECMAFRSHSTNTWSTWQNVLSTPQVITGNYGTTQAGVIRIVVNGVYYYINVFSAYAAGSGGGGA